MQASVTRSSRIGAPAWSSSAAAPMCAEAQRSWMRVFGFGFGDRALPPSSEDLATKRGLPTSRPASRPSARTAACSRATFRSIRERAATECFGTRSSASSRAHPRGEAGTIRETAARCIAWRRTSFGTTPKQERGQWTTWREADCADTRSTFRRWGSGAPLSATPWANGGTRCSGELEAGYTAGIDYFDTFPWYGNGKSELDSEPSCATSRGPRLS